MAKGSEAKTLVIEKIKEVFGSDYIGESNSKHYVWAKDGNAGKVQIAISLTCPKIQLETVDVNSAFGDGMDFEAPQIVAPTKFVPAEITQEEKDNLEELLNRLGL